MSNLISKNTTLSKDNPIIVSSKEEALSVIPIGRSWVKFICPKCNAEVLTHPISLKNYFLCKQCKSKQTNLERYGVENPFQLEKVINATKNRDWTERDKKIRETCLKKYGATSPLGNKEIQDKIKETNKKRYGAENVFASESIKLKIKDTMLEKYGVDNISKLPETIVKIEDTLQKNYGVKHALQSKEIQERYIETSIERFGVKNFASTYEHTTKMRATNLKNFGIEHPKKSRYTMNNDYFDSSWELAFYIYYKDNNINIIREPIKLSYFINDIEHLYYPDFMVDDKLYEIKGSHLLKDNKLYNPFTKEILYEKSECLRENNVTIISNNEIKKYLDYIYNKYGKNYLKNFRIK